MARVSLNERNDFKGMFAMQTERNWGKLLKTFQVKAQFVEWVSNWMIVCVVFRSVGS